MTFKMHISHAAALEWLLHAAELWLDPSNQYEESAACWTFLSASSKSFLWVNVHSWVSMGTRGVYFSEFLSPCPWVLVCERLFTCMCLQVNVVVPITVYCVGAEWSAQRGDWIVCRQPAAATSASDQHYTYRAEYWSTHPNCAAAKWPRKSCQGGRMRPGFILQCLTQTWTRDTLSGLTDRSCHEAD